MISTVSVAMLMLIVACASSSLSAFACCRVSACCCCCWPLHDTRCARMFCFVDTRVVDSCCPSTGRRPSVERRQTLYFVVMVVRHWSRQFFPSIFFHLSPFARSPALVYASRARAQKVMQFGCHDDDSRFFAAAGSLVVVVDS